MGFYLGNERIRRNNPAQRRGRQYQKAKGGRVREGGVLNHQNTIVIHCFVRGPGGAVGSSLWSSQGGS